MIAFLHGTLIHRNIEKSLIILETGGVGYEVYMPMPNFEKNSAYVSAGMDLSLFIHTYVREDRITLYGFNTLLQREIFSLLLDVKDVGPKLAVTILSSIDAGNLINILTTQDISALCAIKGIGQSKAERIIMELKNKILKKSAAFNDIKASDLWIKPLKYLESAGANVNSGGFSRSAQKENYSGTLSGGKSGDEIVNKAISAAKQPSDMIMESAQALEALGYSRLDSFNLASKVFGIVKSEGNIPTATEDLMKECLKHIYSKKNL
jgi:Holliday junction DNA helicase RuvA